MTAEEILRRIEEEGISVDDFAFGEFTAPEDVGAFEEVDQEGGEGQGDHWHSVKFFPKHGVFIRTIGDYSSYHGVDFYHGYGKEVTPREETITVYK